MADALPDEIIANIMQHFEGQQVVRLRRVCRRWRDAVDNLPDSFWKNQCNNEDVYLYTKAEYAKACRKHGLSWRGAYKALNSWNKVEQLPMTTLQPTSCTNINGLQVLPNGIVALFKNLRHSKEKATEKYSDTIIYFNLETNQECGRVEYGFIFSAYTENEHFTVFQKADGSGIQIVTKHDKHLLYIEGKDLKYAVFDNEVYSYTETNVILTKISRVGGKLVVTTKLLPKLRHNIYAVSREDDSMYVMSPEGYVFVLGEKGFVYLETVPPYEDNCGTSTCYGFNWWESMAMFSWHMQKGCAQMDAMYVQYPHPDYSVFCRHGDIFVYANHDSSVIRIADGQSYLNPCDALYCEIIRSKRLPESYSSSRDASPTVLDVVETETHHRILALSQGKLFVVEFQYSVQMIRCKAIKRKNSKMCDLDKLAPVRKSNRIAERKR